MERLRAQQKGSDGNYSINARNSLHSSHEIAFRDNGFEYSSHTCKQRFVLQKVGIHIDEFMYKYVAS